MYTSGTLSQSVQLVKRLQQIWQLGRFWDAIISLELQSSIFVGSKPDVVRAYSSEQSFWVQGPVNFRLKTMLLGQSVCPYERPKSVLEASVRQRRVC